MYPWLEEAFAEVFAGNAGQASENWRQKIEGELQADLGYSGVREDGTATLWCGESSHHFDRTPSPRELLEGLDGAYRREVKRLEREGS